MSAFRELPCLTPMGYECKLDVVGLTLVDRSHVTSLRKDYERRLIIRKKSAGFDPLLVAAPKPRNRKADGRGYDELGPVRLRLSLFANDQHLSPADDLHGDHLR